MREDFIELVIFAKEILKVKKIFVITNESRFCDESFTAEAIQSGIDDVLLSIHGILFFMDSPRKSYI